MGEMSADREKRQARFKRLFQDTVSDLAQNNEEKFEILKGGDSNALGELAGKYDLSQQELVFACDALLGLKQVRTEIQMVMRGIY